MREHLEPRTAAWMLVLSAFWIVGSAHAQVGGPNPARDVGLDQRLDAQVPLEAAFRDESGHAVRLRDFLAKRPVVLALVYYRCPALCQEIVRGLLTCLRSLTLRPGEDFEVILVSIDPAETPEKAAEKKREILRDLSRGDSGAGWHLLTGDEAAIQSVARAIGYRYRYDPPSGQYSHPSGLLVLTPEGRAARYFYGIEYAPKELRLALVEASAGRIGTIVDQVLLLCLQWDPARSRYSLAILAILRVAGIATAAGLGLLIFFLARGRRRSPVGAGAS